MTILFLHGWHSIPGGTKPNYLKDHGQEVPNPSLPDDDFDWAVRIAQGVLDRHQRELTVGSSRVESTHTDGPSHKTAVLDNHHNEREDQMSESETPIKLLAIQAKNESTAGFYLAWIPADLGDDQVVAALAELGIEPQLGIEVGDWRTTSEHVSVAFIPFPPPGLGTELLEPSRS